MKKIKTIAGVCLTLVMTSSMIFSGCGSQSANSDSKEKKVDYPKKAMEFIAPAGAGGGWDLTIRTTAKVLGDTKLVSVPMPITNKTGGGGAIALSYLQQKKGSDSIVTVYSPPLILINLNGSTEYGYKNTTPIARLITDYGAFVVAKDSKYKTINDVMESLKKDPKSVKIGGNSSAGSMDHIQFLLMAKAAGVKNIKEIPYISFQDNSGSAQVLGGHVDVFSTGLGEVRTLIESSQLRALASTAAKRVGTGVIKDVPTCKEMGIDAVFENWRGMFGAPDMPDYALKYWEETFKKMSETEDWKKVCETNGWDMVYQNSEDFKKFLDGCNEQYKEILQEIGMLK
ncbi:Tripartite tricarboxylate transporter family receptor [Clostridium liquoris]|jgi:putative tricarboxylic transport membrane protein|uniref:Tripartite tricarboxylate transporter family receptor n=1 Tax=Clostridium liquoris TaxID=1289519 RepID=A0A2T0B9P6_9CLOT|nr:tripartite tricarboxylate transporter substrate-binding protein [Clostridium liquoris]PRR80575.1 Tripartite tricarboxylate transporter family receptor [Clostridium liquoris]